MEQYEQIQFNHIDNDKYIYKSNNLIESSYSLSLNAQRLIYMGAKKLKPIYVKSNIKPSEFNSFLATQTFGNLKIHVTDFKNEFNIKGKYLYESLMDTARELFDSKIQYLKDDGKIVEKRWVITSEYDKANACVSLTFHPDLILDLLVFRNNHRYGKMQNDAAKVLKNNDQIRTYELLKNSLRKDDSNNKRRFELEDYRYKLAYDDDIYPDYAKLKQRKIKPTIKAINDSTDIEIYDFKEIRYGRKVGAIEFYVRHNNSKELSSYSEVYEDETIDKSHVENVSKIIGIDLKAGMVSKITDHTLEAIKTYKVDMTVYEYIQSKVDYIKNNYNENKINNYTGLLINAIKDNYIDTISESKLDRCEELEWLDEELGIHKSSNNYTSNNSKRFK